jgi:hypothetical protein
MKGKIITILVSFLVLVVILTGISIADGNFGDPAPNSGDGISDGSGFDEPNGPSQGPGPAPNSGLGISDGPGWD